MSHKADEVIKDWIVGLSDDYIIQWANKGLLRRGRKLADKSPREAFDLSGPLTSSLEGHRQKIGGVGFQSIECSCPATGPCHHLVAALLIFRQILSQKTETAVSTAPCAGNNPKGSTPWLVSSREQLQKQVGKAALNKAEKLLFQAVPVDCKEEQNGLVAVIREKTEHTVRIPTSGGLKASSCTCGASRCAHRALAILVVCKEKGIFETEEADREVLSSMQKTALDQVETWLKDLVIRGVGSISNTYIDAGEALATLARQADLPEISSQLTRICLWLADDKTKAARVKPDTLRFALAKIAAHLTALKTRPMPRPFWELAGVHSRRYAMVRDLVLVGAGAETWESQRGYRGFTRYLFDPKRRLWYRHSQVKPVSFAEKTRWRPSEEFNRGRWSAGPVYRDIPGRKIRILLGWTSPDFRISARDGTRIEEVNNDVPEEVTSALPVYYDYLSLAEAYADFLSSSLFSEDPLMPAAVAWSRFEPQQFDPYRQVWSQSIFDSSGRKVNLLMETGPYAEKEAKALDTNLKAREQAIFGLLSQKAGILVLRPVSVALETNPFRWRHLTIEEKQHVGGR